MEKDQASSHPKVVTFIFSAHETSIDGGDCPSFASFEMTQKTIDRLKATKAVMDEHRFARCSTYASPDYWGPGNIENELRLQGDELVVSSLGDMWFSSFPKHADYEIETNAVSVEFLEKSFEAAKDGDFCSTMDDDLDVEIEFHEDALEKLERELLSHGVDVHNGADRDTATTSEVQALLIRHERHATALLVLTSDDQSSSHQPASNS